MVLKPTDSAKGAEFADEKKKKKRLAARVGGGKRGDRNEPPGYVEALNAFHKDIFEQAHLSQYGGVLGEFNTKVCLPCPSPSFVSSGPPPRSPPPPPHLPPPPISPSPLSHRHRPDSGAGHPVWVHRDVLLLLPAGHDCLRGRQHPRAQAGRAEAHVCSPRHRRRSLAARIGPAHTGPHAPARRVWMAAGSTRGGRATRARRTSARGRPG